MVGDVFSVMEANRRAAEAQYELAQCKFTHAQELMGLNVQIVRLNNEINTLKRLIDGFEPQCPFDHSIQRAVRGGRYPFKEGFSARCQFCKDIESWHHGGNFCYNCGRNLRKE